MFKKKTIDTNAKEIRGGILSSSLEVENVLTESLGFLYSSRDNELSHIRLVEDIIADLTFDKKIKILKKNIDFKSGIFKKYNSIIKDLNEIRITRNQIAHRTVSYPWIFDENDLDEDDYNFITEKYVDWKDRCEFYKPGKDEFSFSLEDLKKYQKKCQSVILILRVGISEML